MLKKLQLFLFSLVMLLFFVCCATTIIAGIQSLSNGNGGYFLIIMGVVLIGVTIFKFDKVKNNILNRQTTLLKQIISILFILVLTIWIGGIGYENINLINFGYFN